MAINEEGSGCFFKPNLLAVRHGPQRTKPAQCPFEWNLTLATIAAKNFVAIAYLRMSKLKNLPQNPTTSRAAAIYHLPRWSSISTENGIEPPQPGRTLKRWNEVAMFGEPILVGRQKALQARIDALAFLVFPPGAVGRQIRFREIDAQVPDRSGHISRVLGCSKAFDAGAGGILPEPGSDLQVRRRCHFSIAKANEVDILFFFAEYLVRCADELGACSFLQ